MSDGTVEFRPVDDWWQEDHATALMREGKTARATKPLEPIIQRWIDAFESGEYSREREQEYKRREAEREAKNGTSVKATS